jgi:hypothetical protein
MIKRGYKHNSPLDKKLDKGKSVQDVFWQSKKLQIKILKSKNCGCRL